MTKLQRATSGVSRLLEGSQPSDGVYISSPCSIRIGAPSVDFCEEILRIAAEERQILPVLRKSYYTCFYPHWCAYGLTLFTKTPSGNLKRYEQLLRAYITWRSYLSRNFLVSYPVKCDVSSIDRYENALILLFVYIIDTYCHTLPKLAASESVVVILANVLGLSLALMPRAEVEFPVIHGEILREILRELFKLMQMQCSRGNEVSILFISSIIRWCWWQTKASEERLGS